MASNTITSINDATIKDPTLTTTNNSTTYTLSLPKKNGTLAITDDIPLFDASDFVSKSAPRFNSYTISINTSTYTFPSGDGLTVLTDTKSQTVNNKQLSSSNQIKDGTLLSKSGNTLTFPDTTSTLATKSDITSATNSLATQSSLADVSSNLSALEARVNGMQPAIVFDTLDAMSAWLADSAHTASLVTGTNLFIKELNVPDYWWNGSSASELETAKTDLTNCVTEDGNETLTNKTLISPILKNNTSSSNILEIPTLNTNTTIATTKDLEGYSLTSHNHDETYAAKIHTHDSYALASGGTLTNPTLKRTSTSHILEVPTPEEDTTIATTKDLTGYSLIGHNHDTYALATNGTLTNPALYDNASHKLKFPTPLSADVTIATQEWVDEKGYLREHQSLTNFMYFRGG